jgi:hypothetical protein
MSQDLTPLKVTLKVVFNKVVFFAKSRTKVLMSLEALLELLLVEPFYTYYLEKVATSS